jgi:glycosyltransferase involved in cell wall biosynthesis
MTEMPLVSVIVPTYNRARIIAKTIDNILEQTYPNIELIIVDDGSTDDTATVLEPYRGRIRLVSQENAGPAAARNQGIRFAKGEIVAFQDSDDTWHSTKIARQASLLVRYQNAVACLCNSSLKRSGVVTSSFELADLSPPIDEGLWLNPEEVLTTRFVLFNQAVAVRRDVLARLGGFDESFRLMEDAELAIRLSMEGPWTFIREPLTTLENRLTRRLTDEVTSRKIWECEARIKGRLVSRLAGSEPTVRLRRLAERELKRARRNLRAVEIGERKHFSARLAGWACQRMEQYRSAICRRMPGFPVMKVIAITAADTPDGAECRFHGALSER